MKLLTFLTGLTIGITMYVGMVVVLASMMPTKSEIKTAIEFYMSVPSAE